MKILVVGVSLGLLFLVFAPTHCSSVGVEKVGLGQELVEQHESLKGAEDRVKRGAGKEGKKKKKPKNKRPGSPPYRKRVNKKKLGKLKRPGSHRKNTKQASKKKKKRPKKEKKVGKHKKAQMTNKEQNRKKQNNKPNSLSDSQIELSNIGLANEIHDNKNKNMGGKKDDNNNGKKEKDKIKKDETTTLPKNEDDVIKELSPLDKPKKVSSKQGGNKEYRGKHCDYIDLVGVGYYPRSDFNCAPGGKFLFKPEKGNRRQFLILNDTNIALFLGFRLKALNCTTFNDITDKVKCKPMNGVISMNIKQKQGAPSCSADGQNVCPQQNQASNVTTVAAVTRPPATGSATTVECPCPEDRTFICSTKVESNANSHRVTCNNMAATTIKCGSGLVARKLGLFLQIDAIKHPLCSTQDYTSILTTYVWRCQDRSISPPECESCSGCGATTAMTTAGPGGGRRSRGRDFFQSAVNK